MTGEIYLEIMPVDKALRVTAIDPVTGLEVVFAAPSYTARDRINELARRKLEARIARERGASGSTSTSQPNQRAQRGKLV
ncbi:MAG: hypothetical protein JJ908_03705 [Rhizobiales bacterium]|nr:hypothetical protein [Hyphomicrobiales bacterium]MBO6698292.1 hypothetical protein [Hyphomicrobiales bacterium]MBO6735454.1 hypothetical protein [Hyphomicrobiales bacterium]MBO6910738.1 hypothetical protein [Hyphomicrobiales bacterium]MBO6956747.1 hypothetical protein [Hyphomicrobiales bacterium]